MKYCIFDLETETHCSYKRKANPFDPRNRIVLCGTRMVGGGVDTGVEVLDNENILLSNLDETDVLVGFNIKFDLLYIWKEVQEWLQKGGKIWDCQLAEFMLSAQTEEYPSLDRTAVKYGGTLKDERIKMLWDAGVQTSDIDKEMLSEYLKNDILNTEKTYLGQLEKLKAQPKLRRLIEMHMDSLLATTEMEYNGMYVDVQQLEVLKDRLANEIDRVDYQLDREVEQHCDPNFRDRFNLNSNQHISALLYGGTISTKESLPIEGVFYKTGVRAGQPKYKLQTVEYKFAALCRPPKTTPKGEASVNYESLELIAKKPNTDAGKIATLLVKRRVLSKNFTTYFMAIGDLVQSDGLLHGSLNHCSVITGRLSSTAPNLQNIPKEDDDDPFNIKSVFSSRYGDDGVIVNIDWKSLEFIVAAILCRDPQMVQDIIGGKDIHKENASVVFNVPINSVTDKQRSLAKRASFALLYGGSARGSVGALFDGDEKKGQQFIDTFYSRYPSLKSWHIEWFELAKKNLKSTGVLYKGFYVKKAVLPNISGRLLSFEEATGYKDLPLPMPKLFSSITKNYPVQSLGADIVLCMLGILYRKLLNHRDRCLLINTVHDSIVIDCKKDFLTSLIKGTKLVLESSPKVLEDEFHIEVPVPLGVDITYGKSWGAKV